jgi:hypothetical protein
MGYTLSFRGAMEGKGKEPLLESVNGVCKKCSTIFQIIHTAILKDMHNIFIF